MNLSKNFKHVVKWSWKDLTLLSILSVGATLIIKIFAPNELIVMLLICAPFFKYVVSTRMNAATPSSALDQEQFSWKYLQSLPMSREEVLKFWLMSHLYQNFPLFVWLFCFQPTLMSLFDMNYRWDSPILLVLYFLTCSILISFLSVKGIIVFPRNQFAAKNSKILLLQRIRNLFLGLAAFVVFIWAMVIIKDIFPAELGLSFKILDSVLNFIFNPWGFLAFLIIATIGVYFHVIELWINEKNSYTKLNWNPKRDSALIFGSVAVVCFTMNVMDFGSHFYSGSALNKAVYKKDYKHVTELIAEATDINLPNPYGYTPLMLAAHQGDMKIFKLLESKGAKREGEVKDESDKLHNGLNFEMMVVDGGNAELAKYVFKDARELNFWNKLRGYSALHLAAYDCSLEMADFLLERGADKNALNKEGRTPLHVAAAKGCYPVTVSLLEAGANPLIKDKENKIALNMIEKSNSERVKDLKYFLEKKSRAPAGLKN